MKNCEWNLFDISPKLGIISRACRFDALRLWLLIEALSVYLVATYTLVHNSASTTITRHHSRFAETRFSSPRTPQNARTPPPLLFNGQCFWGDPLIGQIRRVYPLHDVTLFSVWPIQSHFHFPITSRTLTSVHWWFDTGRWMLRAFDWQWRSKHFIYRATNYYEETRAVEPKKKCWLKDNCLYCRESQKGEINIEVKSSSFEIEKQITCEFLQNLTPT